MTATPAAAGLVYLFGDAEPPAPASALRLLDETAMTVTLGWDPVAGAAGYRLFSEQLEDTGRRPHSWDPLLRRDPRFPACNTRFAKGSAWYAVEALFASEPAVWPPPSVPARALVSAASVEVAADGS